MRDFKNLSTFQEIQYNTILDEDKAREARLKPINDHLSKHYIVLDTWEINDFQIAKVRRKSGDTKEILYACFYNYKSLSTMAMNLDEAILVCLGYKYESYISEFPKFAARMLNANFYPEEIE